MVREGGSRGTRDSRGTGGSRGTRDSRGPAAGGRTDADAASATDGERAFLLEVAALEDVLPLHAALAATRPDGVVDLVPAARTVLVRIDPRMLPLSSARTWALAAAAEASPGARASGPLVELDIVYDGADLDDTARLLRVAPDELVRRHAAAEWRVAFTGFAPGFGYLMSDDWPFDVPRLESPRTRVPAGAVGLAGVFAGAYPRETPGGWRLIGTTGARLFDADAASPALLAPGTRVRFRPVTGGTVAASGDLATPVVAVARAAASAPDASAPAASPAKSGDLAKAGESGPNRPAFASSPDLAPAATPGPGIRNLAPAASPGRSIRIIEPGLLATVQDLGRGGAASVGVAVSGALDRTALRTANRLLGNPEGAAGIEVTMGGFRALAGSDLWVAVTGAWGTVRLDGHEMDPYEAHLWRAGTELHIDWFAHGARGYVAVRGGLDGRPALGSRATDLLAGLGPAALRAGDTVALRDEAVAPIPVAPPARGAPRTTTSSTWSSLLDRAPTGSRPTRSARSSTPCGRSRTGPIASARGSTARSSPACAPVSSRARAWSPARCRFRRAAGRPSSSQTARSRAAIPSSRW